ncbi:MAG: alpha/beta fold hydrolase, partial [Alphaproteobacteria bacterium]|nr:alpha/beta fold hydrolase [Alphaproteobacteria bacterium]
MRTLLAAAGVALLAAMPAEAADNRAVPPGVPASPVTNLAHHGYFYVGGHYEGAPGSDIMAGQMYVEVWVPAAVRRPYPIVLIHGAAQTATNWMGTPDGRKGWVHWLVEQGWIVYMIDQPARGRSAWHANDGAIRSFSATQIATRFTATEVLGAWAQAKKHTQWPSDHPNKGRPGDPVFDAFYATQVEYIANNAVTQKLNQDAGAALLDRIGPAVVLTHSQSGPFGWLIADARPDKVRAVVALEPSGPPFQEAVFSQDKGRAWGPADIKLTYDPPVTDPAEIAIEQQATPDRPDLVACWRQKAPARKLVNLQRIPAVVIASEASYHAAYDHCTAQYLAQAGMPVTFVRLEDRG